jgi:hypothetical protein
MRESPGTSMHKRFRSQGACASPSGCRYMELSDVEKPVRKEEDETHIVHPSLLFLCHKAALRSKRNYVKVESKVTGKVLKKGNEQFADIVAICRRPDLREEFEVVKKVDVVTGRAELELVNRAILSGKGTQPVVFYLIERDIPRRW